MERDDNINNDNINNDNINDEINEFEKNLSDLQEWQNNQYNPGYYVGTGRVPVPLLNMVKHPVLLLIIGLTLGLINSISLFTQFSESNFSAGSYFDLILLVVSIFLIYRGIAVLVNSKKTNEK
ncbi:MAG TPA: hypothetical protein PK566_04150 [Pseudobacteroides sp.]|nr:hypothetical protein [Pseudobacteroides sp.]